MDTPTAATLPVSVVLPTLNARSALPAHLDSMRAWLPNVQEVVVVDSFSEDGTAEFLQRELAHLRVHHLTHARGLYESWNHGIAACSAPFLYISTVGDSISASGLHQLVRVAEIGQCDVVISPPRLIDTDGHEVKKDWPVIELLKFLAPSRNELLLEPEGTLLFAVAFLRKALLGSSASNLYRTSVLQARPFPTDFGHAGDVGWGLRHAAKTRLGIITEALSTFVLHPRAKRMVEDGARLRLESARASITRAIGTFPAETIQLCERICAVWERWYASQKQLKQLRASSALSAITLKAMRLRRERKRVEGELQRTQELAMRRIETMARSLP